MALEQLFAGRPVDISAVSERLRKTAAELGLPFGASNYIFNTRMAQELGLWAESRGLGEPFHSAVFRAYFVDGKNIAKIPFLVELAASAGLPEDEAEKILVTGAFKAAVDKDWAIARALEVTAVPTFMINRSRLVGAQSYEAFQDLMDSNEVKRK